MTLKVSRAATYTVEMDEVYAAKLARSLGRVLAAVGRLEPGARTQLVSTHTVDDLLALKTALLLAQEQGRGEEGINHDTYREQTGEDA
jgi:hypothetical protein